MCNLFARYFRRILKIIGDLCKKLESLKENRKFYGILITKENIDYYIPFTSKINKKTNTKLTVNIKNENKIIAKLLLNNMIPVNIEESYIVDVTNSKYKTYYMNEIRYLRSANVQKEIIKKQIIYLQY